MDQVHENTNKLSEQTEKSAGLVELDSSDGSLYPIAVLIDELRTDDVQIRLRSIEKLSVIAKALGPKRTRDELLPFISEAVYDEDEVLEALAERLGCLVSEVGGPEYSYSLLQPLESLAIVEETIVREKALESINKISKQQTPVQIEQHFLPLLRKLATNEWFTSRTSSVGFFASCYSKLGPEIQKELRKLFHNLAHDDTPMVRRACIGNLPEIVRVMEKEPENVLSDIVPIFQFLCEDDQDSVRLLSVEAALALAETLPTAERIPKLWNYFETMIEDKSWRVRYMFVENIVGIMKSMNFDSSPSVQQSFLEAMVNLLRDNEQEVRTIAAEKMRDFAAALNEDQRDQVILNHLLEPIQSLAHDPSQHVRTALAGIVMGIAPLIGNQHTNDNLLPLYLHLLKDECSDVRLNIIKNIHQLNQVMSIDQLMNSILPAVVELAQDGKWRVRLAIIEHMPLLAQQLGKEIFENKLSELVLGWLSDSVYAIREQACKNVTNLAKYFGESWIETCLTPHLRQLSGEASYLRRLTTIFAVNHLVEILDQKQIIAIVLPILEQSAKDEVPNVRFNVAKSFKLLRECLSRVEGEVDSSIPEKCRDCLSMLKEDTDPDVKFYADDSWRDWFEHHEKVFSD